MKVGDLRKAIADLPDDMTVVLEIQPSESDPDWPQAALRDAGVESRCDEVERLYLCGSAEEDEAEMVGELKDDE